MFCSRVKHKLQIESYLMSPSSKVRNAITKLRINAHNLPIEKGRYINLPRENRLCTYCKTKMGDEFHFIKMFPAKINENKK